MKALPTETDRRDCERWAWQLVRHEPAPRWLRLVWRDRLAAALLAKLVAEVEK